MPVTSFKQLKQRRNTVQKIARQHKGHQVWASGTVPRDDFHPGDETVFIIEFDSLRSHGQITRLAPDLEKRLGYRPIEVIDPVEEPEDERKKMFEEVSYLVRRRTLVALETQMARMLTRAKSRYSSV